jgi:fructokinase
VPTPGETWIDVKNPATGEAVDRVPSGTTDDVARAVDAADAAFPAWKKKTSRERGMVLFHAASMVREQHKDLAHLLTLEQGKPASYRFQRQFGADLLLWEQDLDKAMIQSTRVLLLSSLLLVSVPSWEGQWLAVEEAGRSGELVCFDLNHRPGLWPSESDAFVQLDAMLSCTDILKVNESELLLLTGTKDPSHGIPRLLERGVKLAAVTLGERGSYYGTQRIQGAVPAYRVDAVDPLGCGDIFTAALLVRLLEHNKNLIELTQAELEDCFRFANAAGALAATKRGTITAAPDRSEVEALLSK